MKPILLIMAAGIGRRYGGVKQMAKVGSGQETLIDYSIYDAIRAGFNKVVFVINKEIEADFKEFFNAKLKGRIKIEYVIQELNSCTQGVSYSQERTKPWGTGHALLVAKEAIKEPFCLINADDFYGKEGFGIMARYLSSLTPDDKGKYAMIGYLLKNTLSDSGFFNRGICQVDEQGFLREVVERTKIKTEGGVIRSITEGEEHTLSPEAVTSLNFWGFTPDIFEYAQQLFIRFLKERGQDEQAEFYLPDIVFWTIRNNKAKVKVFTNGQKWFGLTYPQDLEMVKKEIAGFIKEDQYPPVLWKD